MSGPRRRHPDKDIEKVLREAEAHRWKVIPGKTYWKAKCPCGQHANWSIKLTPSGANYVKDLSKWFGRQSCWGD
jgi:hypothetical protein